MTKKIDPYNITNFNRTEEELQLFLLFCIVVAGKTAYIQADKLEQFICSVNERLMMPLHVSPFQTIKSADQHGILMEEIQKAKPYANGNFYCSISRKRKTTTRFFIILHGKYYFLLVSSKKVFFSFLYVHL